MEKKCDSLVSIAFDDLQRQTGREVKGRCLLRGCVSYFREATLQRVMGLVKDGDDEVGRSR